MPAWNRWYHVTGSTYGTWLRGDPRGWRARHHREHVEGDYRTPPPAGTHAAQLAISRASLKRDPVRLTHEARRIACDTMVEALRFHDCDVSAIAVGATHFHIVAQFPDHNPRKLVGIAKKRSARALSERALVEAGGVWAIRSRAGIINDEAHLRTATRYVLRHEGQGAATCSGVNPNIPEHKR